jgi:single-stranded-DNA-specific exonuclease
MLRTWRDPQKISVPKAYVDAIGENPLISELLYTRGYKDISSAKRFLDPKCYPPTSALELPGLSEAVQILKNTLSEKKKIGIWGDFDVDGQTSTTVLVSALTEMGGEIAYHIPIRAEESHGINLPALQEFVKSGINLLLTCDTGISAISEIAYLNQVGIPVIITDHHDLPDSLPNADAIINPKMLSINNPLSTLPGVGVAYKLMDELWHQYGEDEKSQQYLDLVALGIIADIAILRKDTRYLLQLGLEKLRHTQRLGLLAIMEYAELNQEHITEEHIGFILAPRMNAIGRLDDANSMVELLTTSDMGRARLLALELEGLNAHRKLLSDQIYQAAEAQLNSDPSLLDSAVLVLSHPSWPAGVVGIVASRLVEQYHRPVILFSSPPDGIARGSARSIESVNITSVIASNRELIKGFGGHPMAAGLAIDSQRIPEFRIAVSHTVEEMGIELKQEQSLQIDGYLTIPDLSLDLVESFERLAPFGAGNPPLVFATHNLTLDGYVAIGRSSDHLLLTIEDEFGHKQQSIWWQGAGFPLPEAKFDLAYSVRASTYRGQRDVQIEWIDYRLSKVEQILLDSKKSSIQMIDYRNEPNPIGRIKVLLDEGSIQIWGEAYIAKFPHCLDRNNLIESDNLAIWTIPPSPAELDEVINRIRPKKVYLFGVNPGMDDPKIFLKRLTGLVKGCIKTTDGITSLSALAAATSQRIQTIQTGLEWLRNHGHLGLEFINQDMVKISLAMKLKKEDTKTSSARLNSMLTESAAFRRYYLTASKEGLLNIDDEA